MEKRCTDVAVCEKACDFCYCWVCDKPWKQCASWKEHCICDGGPEWNLKRQKVLPRRAPRRPPPHAACFLLTPFASASAQHKRHLEAEQAQAQARATGRQQDMADPAEIRRRYENDAAGQAGAMPRSDAEEMRREASEQQAEDEEVEQVFATYEPIHLDYGQPHPDAVVETTSLSFAQLPPITMHSNLPQNMQKPKTASNPYGGALSNLQIETVVYAGMRHSTELPNGNTAGFFLGDGVGLGKGRQLAGIILDNWNQGRKRHLWVSVSADLMQDAIRDLADIGAGHISVINITKTPAGVKLDAGKNGFKEGVIFSTYMGLVSKSAKGTREKQMIQWLGGDKADGCLLFDESHKAKNLVSEEDENGKPTAGKKSTKMALTVQNLQRDCPKARVVYCSATGASSLAHMAYMERLGLWGEQTPFPKFSNFQQAMGNGQNVGAMELVALDMKRRGMYISRQLSFASAEQHQEIVDLTARQTQMYDTACSFWAELFGCFQHALAVLNVKELNKQITARNRGLDKDLKAMGHPAGRVMTHYWGCHQRFFRQLCMAIKIDRTVELSKTALAENKCVVIGLQSTGESRLNDAVADEADLDEFCGMREVIRFLLSKFPTGDYEGRHAEDDADSDDDEAVQEAADNAKRRERSKRGTSARRAAGMESDDSEGDDNGSDLEGFIAHDDSEGQSSEGESSDGEELEGDEPRRRSLPAEIKALPKGLLRKMLQEAGVKHAQCSSTSQLLSRVKGLPNPLGIYNQLGLGDKVGDKRKSPEAAAAATAGARGAAGRKRPSPRGAAAATDDEGEDEGEGEDEAPPAGGDVNGLVGRRVRVCFGGNWRVGDVTKHMASSGRHCVRFDDKQGGDKWLTLAKEKWAIESGRAAPGAAGASSAAQGDQAGGGGRPARGAGRSKAAPMRIADSDDDDEDDEDDAENEPPQASRPSSGASGTSRRSSGGSSSATASGRPSRAAARVGQKKARKAASKEEDESGSDASAENFSSSDEDEEDGSASDDASDEEDEASDDSFSSSAAKKKKAGGKKKAPPKKAAPKKAAPKKAAAKPKPRGRGGARNAAAAGSDDSDDMEVDSLLGDGDDYQNGVDDLSSFQHRNVYEIRNLQSMRRTMVKKLERLDLPDNPLDTLIHELGGSDMVAELTGRKGRLERNADTGQTQYIKRNNGQTDAATGRDVAMERINLHEKSAFMAGEKLVAIISEAASSGISLQADRRVQNRRRRVHITLELPWSADQAIQQCGRTHRSNQAHHSK